MQRLRSTVAEQQRSEFANLAQGLFQGGSQGYGDSKYQRIRFKVHRIIDDPDSHPSAMAFSRVLMGCILLSTVSIVVESMPEFEKKKAFWFNMECAFRLLFCSKLYLVVTSATGDYTNQRMVLMKHPEMTRRETE